MPHNNKGEIYRTTSGGTVKSATSGYVDGDIGVDEADVGIVLGNSSRDTGTLCKASNINKWAKRKPVSFPNQLYKLTDEQLKGINYGLSVPTPNTLLNLQTLYDNLSGADGESNLDAAYSYTKPSGVTLTSPYRLLDFEGYYHGAEAPISIPDSVTKENGNFEIKVKYPMTSYRFSFIMNISGSESVIGLTDLSTSFNDYYLCLGVLKDGVWYIKTALSPVTSSSGSYINLNQETDLNNVIGQEAPRTCVIALCKRRDASWSDNLTQGAAAERLFYYPPMISAASCIGTIKYTAAVGPSVSLYPSIVTAGGDFDHANMQIRLGHQPDTTQTGPVTFNLTLESSTSTSLYGDITLSSNYVDANSISWNQAKTSCSFSGTIQAPANGFPINSTGYCYIPDGGSIFRTDTRNLHTRGTVTWLSQTYNVSNDGQFVVNEQE
jgi:hypothetical protein